jgi:hypothetical protein
MKSDKILHSIKSRVRLLIYFKQFDVQYLEMGILISDNVISRFSSKRSFSTVS